jgi:hypothetical protein
LIATGAVTIRTEASPDRVAGPASVLEVREGTPDPVPARLALGVLLLLLIIAAVLRAIALDAGMWHDELSTLVRYARRPLGDIITIYDSQNQHPLYSILAHITMAIFGESASTLRLPAVVSGVASVAATYAFATLVTNRLEALFAAALLTVSYHHVWFSQNARGYTLLLLLTLIGTGLFVQLLSRARPSRSWTLPVAYAVVMALGVYTHLSAGFVVAGHALVWAAASRASRRAPAAILLATAFSLLLYAPVLPQLMHTLFGPKPHAVEAVWRSPLWLVAETVRGLSVALPGGWLGLLAGVAIAAAGAISYARRAPLALALMVVPPIIVAVVMTALGHNLWPRLFFFAAGFAVLIVVRGIFSMAGVVSRRHGVALAAPALVLVCLGSGLTVPRAWGHKQDFVGAYEYVQANRRPGDAAVVLGLSDLALLEYLEAGWPAPKTVAALRDIEDGHPRTWAIYTFPTHLAALYPDVSERIRTYRVAAEFHGTVGDGTVFVLVNR